MVRIASPTVSTLLLANLLLLLAQADKVTTQPAPVDQVYGVSCQSTQGDSLVQMQALKSNKRIVNEDVHLANAAVPTPMTVELPVNLQTGMFEFPRSSKDAINAYNHAQHDATTKVEPLDGTVQPIVTDPFAAVGALEASGQPAVLPSGMALEKIGMQNEKANTTVIESPPEQYPGYREAQQALKPDSEAKGFPIDSNVPEDMPAEELPATLPPASRELINRGDKVEPSEDDREESVLKDWLGSDFLRGKPSTQLLSIFMMMLLPAGMCTVMYCLYSIIRMMEDSYNTEAEEGDRNVNSGRRLTLGEVMQPSASPNRNYEALCPELLAPADNECLIALPSLNQVSGGPEFECLIVSKTGAPIVRVSLTRMADGMPDVAGGGTQGVTGQTLERISLVAAKRQNALGFCEMLVPNGAGASEQKLKCNIYRPTGDLFAQLEEEPSIGVVSSLLASTPGGHFGGKSYMLTTVSTGARFWIKGDMASRNLVVVSEKDKQKPIIHVESGEQLQFKKEEGNYYRIRVQPKVDAGVVIMALLAMDRLPSSRS